MEVMNMSDFLVQFAKFIGAESLLIVMRCI